ncbi:MaoC/PaaZ C-terminal domain-containing protein [Streptomyces sp. WMMC897]|uniref:MaoC/PaaZ C-terminal domain-containing protein n=1 Tax=Streptomyces sp. WMMC897 TaxID=3014782 RepID=UPI0022B7512D|nr:MaoC/PaaZ C-terminal domain-containing protein [Streptomyces sp. WMMC897]MCZ7415744.1 MaoC/PaaZ C-terminal domain-containing protein [Streptomyces sp. WMMC897]
MDREKTAGTPARTPAVRELRAVPSLLPLYARAVLPKGGPRGGPRGPAPERELTVTARAEPARVHRYAEVCGFPVAAPLPLTYPHLVAFPLAMALMARRDFPHPLLGLVHVANVVERTRPVDPGEELTYRVRTGAEVPHPKGTAFEIHAEARDGDTAVWRSTSTYLRRGRPTGPAAGPGPDEALPRPDRTERWRLPGSTGRAYAAVSGDRNPIHLYPLTARLLGFPRAIAHGMWSKARSLAALADVLPEACRAEVRFRSPVLLPAGVEFGHAVRDGGHAFVLRSADGAREHLRGRVSPLGRTGG